MKTPLQNDNVRVMGGADGCQMVDAAVLIDDRSIHLIPTITLSHRTLRVSIHPTVLPHKHEDNRDGRGEGGGARDVRREGRNEQAQGDGAHRLRGLCVWFGVGGVRV